VLTALISQGYKVLECRRPTSSLPYALLGSLVLLLLTKTEFRRYPSCLGSIFTNTPSGGVSLTENPADISGLPPAYEGFARKFQDICATIQTLAPDGKGVAILDLNDTVLYSAANACPWSRYTSVFDMALTQRMLEDIRNELVGRSPRWVVIRGQNAKRPPDWEFVWAPLYQDVTNRYALYQTMGSYEIWQRSNQP
jgi:hypothetical protein